MDYTTNNKKIDMETIIAIIIIAVMQAVGAIILLNVLTGISFFQNGIGAAIGMFVGLSGVIFGILVLYYTK